MTDKIKKKRNIKKIFRILLIVFGALLLLGILIVSDDVTGQKMLDPFVDLFLLLCWIEIIWGTVLYFVTRKRRNKRDISLDR